VALLQRCWRGQIQQSRIENKGSQRCVGWYRSGACDPLTSYTGCGSTEDRKVRASISKAATILGSPGLLVSRSWIAPRSWHS